MKQKSSTRGALLVLLCALLWAIKGNVGAYLFTHTPLSPHLMSVLRLFFAGLLLMGMSLAKKQSFFSPWRRPKVFFSLLLYGFLGLFLMQATHYEAIRRSNAPTATLIQYLGAFLVVLVIALWHRRWPSKNFLVLFLLAILGTVLLVTKGDLSSLALPGGVLGPALFSAVGYAIYNLALLPVEKEASPIVLVGGGMLLAGTVLVFLYREEILALPPSLPLLLGLSYSIVGGTAIPFVLYAKGQKLLGPSLAPVFALSENLFSEILTILLFHTLPTPVEALGMILLFGAILLLTLQE